MIVRVGEPVHYVGEHGDCYAAVITDVAGVGIGGVVRAVHLTVFPPSVIMFERDVPETPYDPLGLRHHGTWHSLSDHP